MQENVMFALGLPVQRPPRLQLAMHCCPLLTAKLQLHDTLLMYQQLQPGKVLLAGGLTRQHWLR